MNFDIFEFVKNFGKVPDTTSDEKQVYLHFAKLSVQIESNLTRHLGTFDQFCLRCRAEGADLEKIADMTNLSEGIVKERLDFLVNHGYLNTDFALTELGETFLLHFKLVNAFKEHPLELLIDTSIGKLVYNSAEFEGVLKNNRLYPAFESRIQPEKFELTPTYENLLSKEALKWVNNLQGQNISITPDKSPFTFSFISKGVCSLPVTIDKDYLKRILENQASEIQDQKVQKNFFQFYLPAEIVEIEIEFPILTLLDKDTLNAIELIGVSEDIQRLQNIGPKLLSRLYNAGMIAIGDNKIILVTKGLALFNIIEIKRKIDNMGKISIILETFFGSLIDKNIRLCERKAWHKHVSSVLSPERFNELCVQMHPGIDLIPKDTILGFSLNPKCIAERAVLINEDLEFIAEKISQIRRKRILWGTGWHCANCGYEQNSSAWNSSISFDDYPNSTRALYLCPSCEKEVDLDVSSGLSGITFLKLDGTTEKHLIGT